MIALGNNGSITLDGIEMNAYKGDTLMNRLVSGNYEDLVLRAGSNTVSWTGDIDQVDVKNVSRWI